MTYIKCHRYLDEDSNCASNGLRTSVLKWYDGSRFLCDGWEIDNVAFVWLSVSWGVESEECDTIKLFEVTTCTW